MIHVIATIEVAAGKREAFLGEFRKLMPKVHAEDGCIEYRPAVEVITDIAAQVPLGEDFVVVLEKWSSVETLQAHLAAPHMAEYREQVKAIVRSVQLQILKPVD